MKTRTIRLLLGLAAICQALLLATIIHNSTAWIGQTFPGFFLISNRVVPSIALPSWAEGKAAQLFQKQLVAIDGVAVDTAAAAYARVAARPVGTRFTYTMRAPDGALSTFVAPSQRYSPFDYLLIQVAYLLTSFVFCATGLLVAFLKPRSAASLGLLATGLVTGVFVGTAVDLYGPHWFVRLHVLGEVFVAPAFLHLTLVFPRERFPRTRRWLLAALYGVFAGFGLVYELALNSPTVYPLVHLIATAIHGAGAVTLIGVVLYDFVRSGSVLVRRRIMVVAFGTALAFLLPAATMAASAILGGSVPVNAGALTGFLFPLSLGFAIVKRNLFEIDVVLQRAVTHVIVLVLIAGFYVSTLAALGLIMPVRTILGESPFLLALLNVAILFAIAPLQVRMRRVVDHIFFRKRYDTDVAVARLSRDLVSAHTIEDIVMRTRSVLNDTVCPATTGLWQVDAARGTLERVAAGDATPAFVALPASLAQRLDAGEALSRYEWEDEADLPEVFPALAVHLLVPIDRGRTLVFGPKASGRPYNVTDVIFLRSVASQLALGFQNAEAFAEIQSWNVRLETAVWEQTNELRSTNAELSRSVNEVRVAYAQLEEKQASLMRADRLATLGRLTAGIAHEVNTPLGATLNALSVIQKLGEEYAASIGNPSVTPDDHREIAQELVREATAAGTWARKAAAFINRVRVHGRESTASPTGSFAVRDVVREIEALLAHRLRGTTCRIELLADGNPTLRGDPARMGQVLINLVANAVDAYEERGLFDGRVEIRVDAVADGLQITVRDWAGGIPAEHLPHVFEEMFTTKDAGRGTGIGLCIARALIEQTFGGTLTVAVDDGVGTCFTIAVPAAARSVAAVSEGVAATA